MIDTGIVGTRKLRELEKAYAQDGDAFNEWEADFITRLRGATYEWLSSKQQAAIGRLYDKVIMGVK